MNISISSLAIKEPDHVEIYQTIFCFQVHGVFTLWTDFTACSATCGGMRMRTRTCTNPAPKNGGNDCAGHPAEAETCSDPCPGKTTALVVKNILKWPKLLTLGSGTFLEAHGENFLACGKTKLPKAILASLCTLPTRWFYCTTGFWQFSWSESSARNRLKNASEFHRAQKKAIQFNY